MQRILLRFDNLQQVVGSEQLHVIVLTDAERRRALTVVCDADAAQQLTLRLWDSKAACKTMLPEALVQLLPSSYEMLIVGLYEGQYQVMLMDTASGDSVRLRLSDAVLLSIISHVPLYIEKRLMERQGSPYDEESLGVSIPINTMDVDRLQLALKDAVDKEDYRLASQLRDEIKRRKA